MVEAIAREMEWRQDYLRGSEVTSIYFGGGTPSLLSERELNRLLDDVFRLFRVSADAEITLEANPDDLRQDKLAELRASPVNRLSIGVQSFHEEDLRFFNPAHNANEARACIEYAQDLGFDNLTIDLIYGAPTTDDARLEDNLRIAFDYDIPHVSAYALTVEERTALDHFVKTGKAPAPDEEQTARQFELIMAAMREKGYEHYEISNFARPGWCARHNSNYWKDEPYLGLGPSAHSYDGESRQWNIAHNIRYLEALAETAPAAASENFTLDGALNNPLFEREVLTPTQKYNEYVLTRLRTKWGCKLEHIAEELRPHFLEQIQPFVQDGAVTRRSDAFYLTDRGKLLADRIASELFMLD
jgi:oxygen-independent coproporphyrinogen-3 oxidase